MEIHATLMILAAVCNPLPRGRFRRTRPPRWLRSPTAGISTCSHTCRHQDHQKAVSSACCPVTMLGPPPATDTTASKSHGTHGIQERHTTIEAPTQTQTLEALEVLEPLHASELPASVPVLEIEREPHGAEAPERKKPCCCRAAGGRGPGEASAREDS